MNNDKILQIQPNHADHISGYKKKYLDDMFYNECVIAQPKYDGERMLIHFNNGEVYCTSRRKSKKTDRFVENQDRLRDLVEHCSNLTKNNFGYTVLDCECYSKDWSTIAGILHSLPDRAYELCKENLPKFAVFDCLFYDGKDIRDYPYHVRLFGTKTIINKLNYEQMHFVHYINSTMELSDTSTNILSLQQAESIKDCAIRLGFEGIVLKSLQRRYYDKAASLKCKKFETVDCVVCDYEQGNGKYSNTVGALCIGYYDAEKDEVIKISNVNCGTDEERNMWRDNWSELKNSVIEVKCQEITNRSLRHPVYVRLRKDKDYKMCTKETIFKET